jgi:hypothetical protein
MVLKLAHAALEHWSRPSREISREDLNALVTQLHSLLEVRLQRMSKKQSKGSLLSGLNPEQQTIAVLGAIQGFYSLFQANGGAYRVHLLKVANGRPVQWEAFWPSDKPPRTSVEQLEASDSTAMAAIRTQRIQIVESTKGDGALSRFVRRKTPYFENEHSKNEKGSLICYPIVTPTGGGVRYVLCVVAKAQGAFAKRDDELHMWALEKFAKLLQLEIVIAEHCSKGPP